MKRSLQSKSRRAFFLLEAVIALGLFAFAIMGLALAVGEIIDAEKEARSLQERRIDLESLLSEITARRLQEGETELTSRDPAVTYKQKVSLLDIENRDGQKLTGLFEISITARQKFGSKEESVDRAVVYVYQPL